MKKIYLLRHAESAADKTLPEPEWPLSENGLDQADALVAALTKLDIGEIVSSPYRRAVATVTPFASQDGIAINTHHDLRERLLKKEQRDDWLELLQKAWADFSFKLPDCESSLECQQRMLTCVRQLAESSSNESLLISSHGNAISLFLNHIDAAFGFDGWASMKNPDLFQIDYDGESFVWNKTFKL